MISGVALNFLDFVRCTFLNFVQVCRQVVFARKTLPTFMAFVLFDISVHLFLMLGAIELLRECHTTAKWTFEGLVIIMSIHVMFKLCIFVAIDILIAYLTVMDLEFFLLKNNLIVVSGFADIFDCKLRLCPLSYNLRERFHNFLYSFVRQKLLLFYIFSEMRSTIFVLGDLRRSVGQLFRTFLATPTLRHCSGRIIICS